MKRPTMLIEAMLAQASLDLDLSVERDVLTIRSRLKHEGLSFLTITLPLLSDSLERGLEEGRFTCPTSFSRHGRLPRFLGGFFNRVFQRTGELLPEPSADAVYYIRQICRFFKKLKMSCTPAREQAAIDRYLEVEEELRHLTPHLMRKDSVLDKVARIIWTQVFPEFDPNDIICHHGPGVVADRTRFNERHKIRNWYDRVDHVFPSDLHAYPNFGYAWDWEKRAVGGSDLNYYKLSDEPGVRVVFVPKTLTTPRVIAIEPPSMQFIQQGLMDYMVPILEGHRLTRRSIRFSDQSVNQSLAYRSSIDKRLSTLDLKDASDRVHFCLVQRIFAGSGILEPLEAARSLHATLPNGRNVILSKFASMGSAVCFPVEAMVFYTLIQACFHIQDSRRPSGRSILDYSKKIDIYGDDIIVPVEYTDAVVRYLESYGLKVNVNKSFTKSNFRESCGGDFYNGVSVKPIYATEVPHDSARDWTANSVMSWASKSDQFYMNGQWLMAQAIRDMLESVLRRRIPRSRSSTGGGLYFSSLLYDTSLRFNRDLYAYEQKRIFYIPTKVKDIIDGDAAACLNKWGYTNRGTYTRYSAGFVTSRERSILPGRGGIPNADCGIGRSSRHVCALPGLEDPTGRTSSTVFNLSSASTCMDRNQPITSGGVFGPREGNPIDFLASVKRGGFKSKHRWVTIVS